MFQYFHVYTAISVKIKRGSRFFQPLNSRGTVGIYPTSHRSALWNNLSEARAKGTTKSKWDVGFFQPRCEPWCWYIYLHNWVIFRVNVGIHIPAPWFANFSNGALVRAGRCGFHRRHLRIRRAEAWQLAVGSSCGHGFNPGTKSWQIIVETLRSPALQWKKSRYTAIVRPINKSSHTWIHLVGIHYL